MSEQATEAQPEQSTEEGKAKGVVLVQIGLPARDPTDIVVSSQIPIEDTLIFLLRAVEKVRLDHHRAAMKENESGIIRAGGAQVPPWRR
jgi:hypothetical protein